MTAVTSQGESSVNGSDLRRAMTLSLDRKAYVDIISRGQGEIGGVMQPPPSGLWGMPPEVLQTVPGYDPDVQKNRAEARKIMEKAGYEPDKRLSLKVSTRDIAPYRDPAVILLSQLKHIYIDAELERIQQQVELIREQAALSTDPELLSQRIDEITATLGTTGQWIRDQQQVYGAMEDLLTDPPPLAPDARARESQ